MCIENEHTLYAVSTYDFFCNCLFVSIDSIGFIFLDTACPTNYEPSFFIDGRTCIGSTNNSVQLDKNMCTTEYDDLRSPISHLNPEIILSLRHQM